MNQLLNVTIGENNEPVISGRELHSFLEATERYANWFERMTQYGLTENADYVGCKVFNAQARQELQDHMIKIDAAKEIAMIQRNEKGRQARQYFIQIEKEWNSPEKVMARALKIADEKIKNLSVQIEADKPKVLFADAVEVAQTSILIGDLAKLIKQNGRDVGQNRLFQRLRDKGYLIKNGDSRNMPTQRAMDMKLFEVRERTVSCPDGSVRITKTTKVTGKGQVYFINAFLNTPVM